MSETKHTPGPWREEFGEAIRVRDEEGGQVCMLGNLRGKFGLLGRREPNEVDANARLIAAAPELLEACIALTRDTFVGTQDPAIIMARAAIKKATGGWS